VDVTTSDIINFCFCNYLQYNLLKNGVIYNLLLHVFITRLSFIMIPSSLFSRYFKIVSDCRTIIVILIILHFTRNLLSYRFYHYYPCATSGHGSAKYRFSEEIILMSILADVKLRSITRKDEAYRISRRDIRSSPFSLFSIATSIFFLIMSFPFL